MTSAVVTLSHELGGKALKDCIQSGTKLGRLRKLPATGRGLFISGFPNRRNDIIYNVHIEESICLEISASVCEDAFMSIRCPAV